METLFFLKGLLLGFSIAAPVGPIGVLCIRRTLASGMLTGFVSGLGTATADAIYGLVAAFGVTAVAGALLDHQFALRLIGGSFLAYLGWRTFSAEPAARAADLRGGSMLAAYTSAFFLTLTNPMTILSFAAVFAGLGVGAGSQWTAGFLVLGVFIGSAGWWLTLSAAAGAFRSRLDHRRLKIVNRLSGLVILGFAAACFLTL
ncbi:MAG: LysE family transporter [Negativicutes bacterium]|nr:LysE family transporter [Negativicutes bacterium]